MNESLCKVLPDGTKEWRLPNRKLHRLDGPAVEYANGSKEWWVDGNLHRLNGPAVEYADGSKAWWVDGKLHRLDGPAREWANGHKEWWADHENLTEQEFFHKLCEIKNISKEDKFIYYMRGMDEFLKRLI